MTIHCPAIAAVAVALVGCFAACNKDSGAPSASASASASAAATTTATTTATATAAAKKGDPEPAITAGPRKPFDALVFRNTGEMNKSGWPKFDIYNQADKKVKYASIYAYAYDNAGKVVTRTDVPLSWNDNSGLEPGKKASFSVEIDSWGKAPVGAGAVKFELCYDSMKFDDDKFVNDDKHCPKTRPLGGVK